MRLMTQAAPVHVTMVKKILASGEPCRKCAQAEEMLRRRDLWEAIDEVVLADEKDPESAGMVLAREHHVELAPFFVVRRGDSLEIYDSAVKLSKEVLRDKAGASAPAKGAEAPAASGDRVSESEIREAALRLRDAGPEEVLDFALGRLGRRCALAFSGAEDVALIHMASKLKHDFSVFCLETGRLHPQTYRFIDTVRQVYGIEIQLVFPHFVSVERLVREKGLFSFYEDGHEECCGVRKIEPLRRVLQGFSGWVTGQRRDQSPTRTDVPTVDFDQAHVEQGLLKVNPLATWTQSQVWEYIRAEGVPYNELHDEGYVSIGCEPCTRARRPGEHERAARWWWEDATKRECGLHLG